MGAELSPIFGFLIILKDSFKLLFKNGKFMAPITLLFLLLTSLLLFLFFYVCQILTKSIYNTDSSSNLQNIAYLCLLLLFEITCIIASTIISNISGIATILVSATSYADSSLDLYSRIKTSCRRSKLLGYRNSSSKRKGTVFLALFVWMLAIYMVIFYPNVITISVAVVVGISVYGFLLYCSVSTVLSGVVSVLEEKFEGSEALERAEELIQGQRHHGFMINVFINLLLLIIVVGFWLGLRGELLTVNAAGFWLCLVIFLCLAKIIGCVAYTVLYFRCKKNHGDDEEVGVVPNFGYSKLPASDLGGIP